MSFIPIRSGRNTYTRQTPASSSTMSGSNTQARPRQQNSGRNSQPRTAQKPPLTHFISIPIGHHLGISSKWTQISQSLLNASPAIPGLDESVIIKPGGLHVTLGVMSLREDGESTSEHTRQREVQINSMETLQPHSVQDALALLKTLQEPIKELIRQESNSDPVLYLPLERLDIMRNGRKQEFDDAHILWAGPSLDGELGKKFERVCALVHSTFKRAGYLQDARPLKLHCTLINTVYRKQYHNRRKERIPFSYSSILSSAAYRLISIPDNGVGTVRLGSGPCKIDLGSWPVDEIQICKMGSQDARGVYKSVGGISLR